MPIIDNTARGLASISLKNQFNKNVATNAQECANLMTSGLKEIQLSAGTFDFTGSTPPDLQPGTTIRGVGQDTIIRGNTNLFKLRDNVTVQDMAFVNNGGVNTGGIYMYTTTAVTGASVRNCSFSSFGQAVRVNTASDNTTHNKLNFNGLTFSNNTYDMYVDRMRDSAVQNIRSTKTIATGRCFEMGAGYGNSLSNFFVDGGITAVAFLTRRTQEGTGGNPFRDNIVSNIHVRNCSEESVTMDIRGNSTTDGALVHSSSIATKVTSPTFTLSGSFTGQASMANMYLVFNSGTLKGYGVYLITQNTAGSAQVTLDMSSADYANVNVGDQVSIGWPAIGNVFDNLDIECPAAYQNSIGFNIWGFGYYNTITNFKIRHRYRGATVSAGLRVSSLIGVSIGGVGTTGNALCEYNSIAAGALIDCDVYLQTQIYTGTPLYSNNNLVNVSVTTPRGIRSEYQATV